jgi:hypothetical protein
VVLALYMTFRHLEDKLQGIGDRCAESYLEVFGGLQEPTRTVLGYTLDIASFLDGAGVGGNYVVFGGYGVLSHIMEQFGESAAKVWRGSNDIDMGGDERVLGFIRAGFDVKSELYSPNLSDKRTLKLTEDHEPECKIDFYTGNISERFPNPEVNAHFGIPLRVADPLSLISGKLITPRAEIVHSYDILTLLSVLDRRGHEPGEIISHFLGEERSLLYERLKSAMSLYEEDRVGFFPSSGFVNDLIEGLRKRRDVVSE